MNIALFASAFYPHIGGVEELVRQLAHAYREAGHNAIVVTNQWPPTLATSEEYEGIPIYRLPMRTPEGRWKERLKYSLTYPGTKRRMLTILRGHAIDLIHVQCVGANGYYALLAKQALHLPLVVTAQGERTMDATGLYQRSTLINRVLRQLLNEADHITACSRHTLDDIENYYGQPFGARASVVYNGIQTGDFMSVAPFSHPRPYLLGIGRLVPQKGFDVLMRAFAQASLPGYDLLLAGEGTERAELEKLSAQLGMQARVHLMGRADRARAVSLFKGCAFFVLPSRQEPFGIVSLEAMTAGKAVVASRVGGVPEVVRDGKDGLLVPAEDVSALAEAMTALAADPGRQARLGRSGQVRAQEFAWPAIMDAYQIIYQRAVQGRATS